MALRHRWWVTAVLTGILAFLLLLQVAQQPDGWYTPVTVERLRSPDSADWLMYRRTFDSWGYSPLDQITTENVTELVPIFSMSTELSSAHQSPPIVNNGVLFFTTPGDQVIAVNMRTGERLWRYQRQFPPGMAHPYRTNRGVGLYGDKVFYTTHDAFVVALDATSGAVAWENTGRRLPNRVLHEHGAARGGRQGDGRPVGRRQRHPRVRGGPRSRDRTRCLALAHHPRTG